VEHRFKLEALRQYRSSQEESRQKEMAGAQRVRDHEAAVLAELTALRDNAEKDLKSQQEGSTTGPRLTIYNNYLNKLASDIFAQKFKLADAEKMLAKKREALLLAMQKRKTLEKLKEKSQKAYIQNLNSDEAKFINEMAINRFTAKHR
jgi:flagellar export protein FliJ